MPKCYITADIRPETEQLLAACKEEYLKHHTDMEGEHISRDFIIKRIARFYLEH